MFLDLNNEIDKRILATFSPDIIESITPENLDYFGLNVSVDTGDITLKTYYLHNYSMALYNDKEDDCIISFLKNKNMLNFFSVLKDSAYMDKEIYDVKISSRTNQNMLELFSFMDKNISFFGKYKDEIIKLSNIKNRVYEGYDYASFYFFSIVKEGTEIKTLKCYWDNNYKIENDDYFFKFLETSGVVKLQELIPITKTIIKNCGGHLALEGINYNKDYSEKHKVYITNQNDNLYDGLITSFPNKFNLYETLSLVENWQKIHSEFYCDGLSIGTDDKGQFVLNFYFKFLEEENV